jgi:hypothetical protein
MTEAMFLFFMLKAARIEPNIATDMDNITQIKNICQGKKK